MRLILIILITQLLSGCAAGLIAAGAGTASLLNDERSLSTIYHDQTMAHRAYRALRGSATLHTANISVTVVNHKILLTGQTPRAAQKQHAENLIKALPGKKTVLNHLVIKQPVSAKQASQDTWITGKVKSTLLTESDIKSTKIKVVTEEGRVYLLGLVTHHQSERIIDTTRRIRGVKQVIPLFEIIP